MNDDDDNWTAVDRGLTKHEPIGYSKISLNPDQYTVLEAK